MTRVRIALLTLVAFLLAACQGPATGGPDAQEPQPLVGVITGTLTDSTGALVVGAQVTLGSEALTTAALTQASVQLVFTNSDGQFAFDVDQAGDYTLTTLTDNEGAFMRVTVTRMPDGSLGSTPVMLQAAELGAVAGRIAGKGAGSWAYLLGTSFLASTDDDGAFIISRVPAGTYRLAPGLLGAVGTPVEVTVEAGQLTSVTEALVFGPVITGVEPEGFTAWGWDPKTGMNTPSQIVIRGNGFGTTIGISQLRYAGIDITDYVVSWTDTEITVDTHVLWGGSGSKVVNLEDLRYKLSGITGAADSEPGGVASGYMYRTGCQSDGDWVSVTLELFWVVRANGAEVTLEVFNGVALSGPGGHAVSTILTNENGCAEAYVVPTTTARLPIIVKVFFFGIELSPVSLTSTLAELDSYSFRPGQTTISGTLADSTSGEPMADDGHYRAGIQCAYHPLGTTVPISLNAQGAFEALLTIPDDALCNTLVVLYRDVPVADLMFEVVTDVHLPLVFATTSYDEPVTNATLAPRQTAFVGVEVPSAVAAAGTALYLELGTDLLLEATWQGATYYSSSNAYFSSDPVEPVSMDLLRPSAIGTHYNCLGSCVIVDSSANYAFVAITNPYDDYVDAPLYAYVQDFEDLNEPLNNTRAGAEEIPTPQTVTGALETVGDVDYFVVGPLSGVAYFDSPMHVEVVAYVERAGGQTYGPFPDRSSFQVSQGDYIRIEAVGPIAATSANSAYYLTLETD